MKRKKDRVTPYSQLLKDPRWQKKRLEVLSINDWMCISCGAKESELHIHHIRYRRGKKPWEYTPEELLVLCADCHEQLEKAKEDFESDLVAHACIAGNLISTYKTLSGYLCGDLEPMERPTDRKETEEFILGVAMARLIRNHFLVDRLFDEIGSRQ